jgi:ribosomal protein S6
MATVKKFTPPKSLAVCADMLYTIREERYALNAEVEALAAKEGILREHLINNLPKSSATGISGKVANAKIERKQIVIVESFDKTLAYCIKNQSKGAFALLQRRINESAVKEIWALKKAVPGLKAGSVPVVSLTKR